MNLINLASNQITNQGGSPLQLHIGDKVNAKVIAISDKNEATIKIGVQEYKATFEETVPKKNEVAIQILGMNEESVQVKVVESVVNQKNTSGDEAGTKQNHTQLTTTEKLPKEVKEATDLLIKHNRPITKETVDEIKNFMKYANGTTEQKLNTIIIVADKGIEVTNNHLNFVHESLYGKSLSKTIQELSTVLSEMIEMDTSDDVKGVLETIQEVKEGLAKNKKPTNLLKELEKRLESVDIKSLNQLKVVTSDMDMMSDTPLSKNEVDVLLKGMNQIEEAVMGIQVQSERVQSYENEVNIPTGSKDFAVTKVSQKMAEITNEFKELKKEVFRQLDYVIRNNNPTTKISANAALETVISQLDRAISKSNLTLYTDMKTERRLVQFSSQLAEAKTLLNKGQYNEAQKLVTQVRGDIEKLNFRPSETKVQHYVMTEKQNQEARTPKQQLSIMLAQQRFAVPQEPSGRQVIEALRKLGLDRENGMQQQLVSRGKNEQINQQSNQSKHGSNQESLKALLMRLSKEEGGTKVGNQANQAVSNITGQQLTSKTDFSSQNLLLNIPIEVNKDLENVQVYINAREDTKKVDWENCSLYFLFNTKNYGEVGVSITITDKNLSVKINNNDDEFVKTVAPLVDSYKENLQEIGYRFKGVTYDRMNNETPTEANLVNTSSSIDKTVDKTVDKTNKEGVDVMI